MSIVQVQINFTVQETPEPVRKAYSSSKDWEVLEPDGFRLAFADTEQEARDAIHDHVYDWLTSVNFSLTTVGGE